MIWLASGCVDKGAQTQRTFERNSAREVNLIVGEHLGRKTFFSIEV